MGYGESKYLAERMFDYVSLKLGRKTSVIRLGQISGTAERPRNWSREEWLPSLVLSSRYIGVAPESLGSKGSSGSPGMMDDIDWVPIDQLAKVLVEFTFVGPQDEEGYASRVFHAVNPYPTTWEHMLPAMK